VSDCTASSLTTTDLNYGGYYRFQNYVAFIFVLPLCFSLRRITEWPTLSLSLFDVSVLLCHFALAVFWLYRCCSIADDMNSDGITNYRIMGHLFYQLVHKLQIAVGLINTLRVEWFNNNTYCLRDPAWKSKTGHYWRGRLPWSVWASPHGLLINLPPRPFLVKCSWSRIVFCWLQSRGRCSKWKCLSSITFISFASRVVIFLFSCICTTTVTSLVLIFSWQELHFVFVFLQKVNHLALTPWTACCPWSVRAFFSGRAWTMHKGVAILNQTAKLIVNDIW